MSGRSRGCRRTRATSAWCFRTSCCSRTARSRRTWCSPCACRGAAGQSRSGGFAWVLDLVHLKGLEARYPHQLSGGQKQRVALAPRPGLPAVGAASRRAARQPRSRAAPRDGSRDPALSADLGIPFVYVTHNQEEALTLSDRIAVMHEGRIEQVGPSSRSITVRRPGLSPASSARRTACTRASPSRTATMPDWRGMAST